MRLSRLRDESAAAEVDGVMAFPDMFFFGVFGVGVRVGMFIDISNAGDSFRVVRELYDESEIGGRRGWEIGRAHV